MNPLVSIEVEDASLERVGADVAVVGFFEDERPLRGGAGIADWRLCGWLSELVRSGRARGSVQDHILVPTFERLRAPRLLVLGLGSRARYGLQELAAAANRSVQLVLSLESHSAILGLPLPEESPARLGDAILHGVVQRLDEQPAPLLLRVMAEATGPDALLRGLQDASRRLKHPALAIRTGEPLEARGRGPRGRPSDPEAARNPGSDQVGLHPADPVHGPAPAPGSATPRRIG